MKKAIAFSLLLCLLFTGCAAHEAVETTNPGSLLETEMVFMVEGMEESCPATAHEGKGYTIYIPDEGWQLEQTGGDEILGEDYFCDSWVSVHNADVLLEVVFHPGATENDIKTGISPAPIVPTENGFWLMEQRWETQGRSFAEIIRLYPAQSGVYTVKMEYPAEAAEGFGVRLPVIADTFELA